MIQPDSLQSSLAVSLESASWLTNADAVSIAWAFYLAKRLDEFAEPGDVARYGKLFETVTRDLGLSIAGRLGKPDEPSKELSPLDVIRQNKVQDQTPIGKPKSKSPNTTSTGKRKPPARSDSTKRSTRNAPVGVAKKRSARNPENK